MKERIVTELLDEARKRRAEEALQAFDRQLEETRRRVVRSRAGQAALDQSIRDAEDASQLSSDAGLDGVMRFTTASVNALGRLSDAFDAQADRVDALADRVDALVEELEAARPPSPAVPPRGPGAVGWQSPLERAPELVGVACARLRAAAGRVLHADCGSGAVVAALLAAGIDAYGTDPSGVLVEEPQRPGLDLVQAEAVGHLRSLAPAELGGVLLSGFVDRLSPGEARRLAFLLGTHLAPGMPVVLTGTEPATWQREASPVQRDLAPGRPLHPETWCHLLGEYGFDRLQTTTPTGAYLVSGICAA